MHAGRWPVLRSVAAGMMQFHANNSALGLEKIGLAPGETDFNIERIVRMAAMALNASRAGFSVFSQGVRVDVAAHGEELHIGPDQTSIAATAVQTGAPIYRHGRDLMLPNQSAAVVGSAAAAPVLAVDGSVIGALWLGRADQTSLQDDYGWRVLNDSVRLIEDSLHMRQSAIRDELTGLHNRRFFDDQLHNEWFRCMRKKEPLGLILLDLDHFKSINDTAGHSAGDAVIRAVAKVLKAQLHRASDSLCRYGGEEFAVLQPGSDAAMTQALANTLRKAVAALGLAHPGDPVAGLGVVTISLGVANAIPRREDSVMRLVETADQALYLAKTSGRNQVQVVAIAPDA